MVRTLLLAASLWSSTLYGQVVHIGIQEPSGGAGDVVANLIMARLLQEERPAASIHLLFDPEDDMMLRIIKLVYPAFNPLEENLQQLDGLKFFSRKSPALPTPSALISFSSIGDEKPYGRMTIAYTEFNLAASPQLDGPPDDLKVRTFMPPHSLTDNEGAPLVVTGFGSSGLYIRKQKPTPKPRESVIADVRQQISDKHLLGPAIDLRDDDLLALSYTKESHAVRRYLKAIAKRAQTPGYRRKNIIVIMNKHNGFIPPSLPANVSILYMNGLPNRTFEDLFDHLAFPPLVRGDNSVSQAIDREIPFFYEMSSWKDFFSSRLIEFLVRESSLPERNLATWLMIAEQHPSTTADDFGELMVDSDSQRRFAMALAKLREDHALAPKVWAHLDALAELKHEISGQAKTLVVSLTDLGFRGDDLKKFLRRMARDQNDEFNDAMARVLAMEVLAGYAGMEVDDITAIESILADVWEKKDYYLTHYFAEYISRPNLSRNFLTVMANFWQAKNLSHAQFFAVVGTIINWPDDDYVEPVAEVRSILLDRERPIQERLDAAGEWVTAIWDASGDDVAIFKQLVKQADAGELGAFRAHFDNFVAVQMTSLKVRSILAESLQSDDRSLRRGAVRLLMLALNVTTEGDLDQFRGSAVSMVQDLPSCPEVLSRSARKRQRDAIFPVGVRSN